MAIGATISIAADGILLAKGEFHTAAAPRCRRRAVPFAVTLRYYPSSGSQAAGLGCLPPSWRSDWCSPPRWTPRWHTVVLTVVPPSPQPSWRQGRMGRPHRFVGSRWSRGGKWLLWRRLDLVVMLCRPLSGVSDTLRLADAPLESPRRLEFGEG